MLKSWTIKIGISYMIAFLIAGCSGVRPTNLGVQDGQLAPCPDSPNCVSSQSKDKDHNSQPFTFDGEPGQAWFRLIQLVKSEKRVTVITEQEGYLHAEFRSALWGFVDDLELFMAPDQSVIHVRSASRLGHSDLGVNRKRVEHLRHLFLKNE